MVQYKYLSMEYGSIHSEFCNIHKSSGTLPATKMHYHDFYQIYFITKGKMLHRTPEQQCLLHSGDCFIIPPHFPHSIEKGKESPEFYAFSFRPDFLDVAVLSLLPQLQTPETLRLGLSLSGGEIHMLEQLLECCLREFEQQSFGWETAAKGMLQAILVLFSRAYSDVHPVFTGQSAIIECVQYVDTHFREDIRLDKLLPRYHFSVSGFYRAFREMTGKSFRQYLTQKEDGTRQLFAAQHKSVSASNCRSMWVCGLLCILSGFLQTYWPESGPIPQNSKTRDIGGYKQKEWVLTGHKQKALSSASVQKCSQLQGL